MIRQMMLRQLAFACAVAAIIFSAAPASHAADTLLERGAYLMNGIVACGNCHNMRGPDGRFIEGGELAGGFVIAETMFTARVPNIPPDMATGIGAWSDAEIAAALTKGVRPDGGQLHPIMPSGFYASMTEADVDALVAFLRTVKPIVNAVR